MCLSVFGQNGGEHTFHFKHKRIRVSSIMVSIPINITCSGCASKPELSFVYPNRSTRSNNDATVSFNVFTYRVLALRLMHQHILHPLVLLHSFSPFRCKSCYCYNFTLKLPGINLTLPRFTLRKSA